MKDKVHFPPGPSHFLPYQLVRRFSSNPIVTLTDITSKYGDIAHFKFGRKHVYFLNNPEYIEDVLVTYQNNFIKTRTITLTKRVMGEGLLTSEGNLHNRQRRLMQPFFSNEKVSKFSKVILNQGIDFCEKWKDGDIIDLHLEMTKLSIGIIAQILFGSHLSSYQLERVAKIVAILVGHLYRVRKPLGELLEKLPLPKIIEYKNAKKELDQIINLMISNSYGLNEGARNPDDILSGLLSTQRSTKEPDPMSDTQIRDEIVTLFLSGHETIANSLTWTFYLISEHPEVEEQIVRELSRIFEGQRQNHLDLGSIQEFRYIKNVFKESLRLYPPAWASGRKAVADTQVGGYKISKGSIILMSQYVMHHDCRYFKEANIFKPDRWSVEFEERLPKFSYFPFGGGGRGCIGENLAWTEGILLISILCRRWKMEHIRGQKVEVKPLLNLRPKYKIHMKLMKREF